MTSFSRQNTLKSKKNIIRLFAIEKSVMLQSLSFTGLKTQKLFLELPLQASCWPGVFAIFFDLSTYMYEIKALHYGKCFFTIFVTHNGM